MKKIFAALLIAVLFAAAVSATVRSRQEPGASHTGLSSDSKPTVGVKPGDTFTEPAIHLRRLGLESQNGRPGNGA